MNNICKQKRYIKNNTRGLTIFEIVIYFSMLSVLTVVVMSSLISLFKSYSVIKLQQDIERDIHDANDIVLGQSSFSVPEGAIALSITEGASTDIYRYYNSSSTLKVSKNGTFLGNLSQSGVMVDSFIVRQISGTSTSAIKVELVLRATPRYGTSTVYENFYTTVQQRN
jgi:hypothetical protein